MYGLLNTEATCTGEEMFFSIVALQLLRIFFTLSDYLSLQIRKTSRQVNKQQLIQYTNCSVHITPKPFAHAEQEALLLQRDRATTYHVSRNVENMKNPNFENACSRSHAMTELLVFYVFFSRASRTLRDATEVVTFLSVRDKKMSGRTEKVTLFNAFLQAGLTDLD